MKLFVIKFFAFYCACLACSTLQTSFGFSAVLSTALVGFVGSFFHFLAPIIYVGSFAGMTSQEYLSQPAQMVFISLVGAGVYLLSKRHLVGFGGKLGTVAFVSCCFLVLTKNLW